mmetsp:Transcript_1758/g.7631  ORF Transcript_1758/g.7631 Transcript_1758/m.7631 type:complete len:237 (-) Transcript_1758:2109-2819(-)
MKGHSSRCSPWTHIRFGSICRKHAPRESQRSVQVPASQVLGIASDALEHALVNAAEGFCDVVLWGHLSRLLTERAAVHEDASRLDSLDEWRKQRAWWREELFSSGSYMPARRWQAESDQQRPGAPAEGPCFPVAWVPFIRTMGKKAMANSEVHAAEAALLVRPESVESSTLRLSLARQAFKSVVANALLGVGNAYTSRSLQRLSELSETSQAYVAYVTNREIFNAGNELEHQDALM